MSQNSFIADAGSGSGDGRLEAEYRTIDLSIYVGAIWRRRYKVVGAALLGLLVSAAISLLLPRQYDATARLQPPAPREMGLSSLLPTTNQGDLYLGLLDSRTVADDVIEHQNLKEYFHTTRVSVLRRRLASMSTIRTDKNQFITVVVRAPQPQAAMRIANEYVDALYRLNHAISLAQAEHRWEYFEGPLEQEKNKLAQAEEELKQAQQRTGMVLPEAQVRMGVTALGQLKQEIANREVLLASLRTGSTDNNPRVIELRSQIANLYGQVARMEADTTGATGSKAKLPELTLVVERKQREVRYHETLFGILSRQYENARIDQSYTQPVEIVDRAVLPDEKSWPPRTLFAILGFLGGGMLGLLLVSLQAAHWPRQLKNHFLDIDKRANGSVSNQ